MARIIHSINMALNGFCSHSNAIIDADHQAYALRLLESAQALLFGRGTYQLFADFWPRAITDPTLNPGDLAIGQALDALPKFVMSSRALKSSWRNTTHLSGSLREQITSLRHAIAGNLLIFGSPQLATALLALGEIDEHQLLIAPLFGAVGPVLHSNLGEVMRLKLNSVRPLGAGTLLAIYSRAGT